MMRKQAEASTSRDRRRAEIAARAALSASVSGSRKSFFDSDALDYDLQDSKGRQSMNVEFSICDKAVYPAQGVAEVVGIEEKEISGKITKFYVLKILDTEMKIMVPTHKAGQVGLRPVATTNEIKEVMQILREPNVRMDKQTWNRRYRGFMEKIKTGSLFEVAEVYRDLSRLKNTKTLSFGEKRMLDTARNLIVKELSVAQNTSANSIEKKLEKLFS